MIDSQWDDPVLRSQLGESRTQTGFTVNQEESTTTGSEQLSTGSTHAHDARVQSVDIVTADAGRDPPLDLPSIAEQVSEAREIA